MLGNQEYDAGRGGGFVSDRSKALKATLSGVFPGDYLLSDPSGYFALKLYRCFVQTHEFAWRCPRAREQARPRINPTCLQDASQSALPAPLWQ